MGLCHPVHTHLLYICDHSADFGGIYIHICLYIPRLERKAWIVVRTRGYLRSCQEKKDLFKADFKVLPKLSALYAPGVA